jgi:hypothetical protein
MKCAVLEVFAAKQNCNRYLNIMAGYYSSDILGELFFERHRITEHENDDCNSGIRTENK